MSDKTGGILFSPSRSAAAPELAYLKSFRHKQKHVAQASYDVETTSSGPSRTRPGGALTQAPRRRDKACLEACRLVSGEARSSLCESDWLQIGLSAVAARRRAAHFVGSQQRWNVQVSKERREGKRREEKGVVVVATSVSRCGKPAHNGSKS